MDSDSPCCSACSVSELAHALGSGEGMVLGLASALGSGEGAVSGLNHVSAPCSGSCFREGSPLAPVAPPPALITDPPATAYHLCHLNHDQLHVLWHQCLGHFHSRHMSNLHKYAQGLPFVPIATELDSCPICARAKLHHADWSAVDSQCAIMCNQGISVDFGFMV